MNLQQKSVSHCLRVQLPKAIDWDDVSNVKERLILVSSVSPGEPSDMSPRLYTDQNHNQNVEISRGVYIYRAFKILLVFYIKEGEEKKSILKLRKYL